MSVALGTLSIPRYYGRCTDWYTSSLAPESRSWHHEKEEDMKVPSIETTAMYLLILGGLNAGVNAIFDYNAIGHLASASNSTVSTVLYALMGLAALWMVADRFGILPGDDA